MDLIARLHRFLFEIEEDLGESRLLLRQREHGLIHHLHAERRLYAFAARVSDSEMHARIVARFVRRGIGRCFDLQLVGRLHEDQAMIRHRPRVAADHVRVRDRACPPSRESR